MKSIIVKVIGGIFAFAFFALMRGLISAGVNAANDETTTTLLSQSQYESEITPPRAKTNHIWDESKQIFYDYDRNLKIDLSNSTDYTVTEKENLSKSDLFGVYFEDIETSMILSVVDGKTRPGVTSIYDMEDGLIKGVKRSYKSQIPKIPGFEYSDPKIEKLKILNYDALKFTFSPEITDSSKIDENVTPFSFVIYSFYQNGEILTITLLIPIEIIKKYGEDLSFVLASNLTNL